MKNNLEHSLVICDLDTMLLDESGNLPQVTRDVLQLFTSRGGRFTVFSQRTPRAVRALLGGIRLASPALLCGGSLLYNLSTGESQVLGGLQDYGPEFLQRLPAGQGIGAALQMQDGTTRVLRMSARLQRHLRQEWTPYILGKAEDVSGNDLLRILLYKDLRFIPIMQVFEKALLESVAPPCIEHVAADTMAISARSLTGKVMLQAVCSAAGVEPYQAIVLAGSMPMLEMVRNAGRSATAADAPAELRVAARETTLTNSRAGSAAEYLYRLVRNIEA